MKKLFSFLLIATLFLGLTVPAHALYGLEKFWGAVYDENGNIRTDVSSVTVYTVNTTTAATVYSDDQGTSLTNPITSGLSDGTFEFYSATATFDVLVQAGSRAVLLEDWTTSSKHNITIDSQNTVSKSIRFTPGQFEAVNVGESALVNLRTGGVTFPQLQLENGLAAIVWNDGDESYAQVTFRVPDDYLQGGAFRIMTDYSTGAANPQVHFRVFVNSDGTAWDSAATAQTAVDPAGTAGTPEVSTLSVTTDFDSLAAGDVVTAQVARSDQESSVTADLEVYYLEFYYVGKN